MDTELELLNAAVLTLGALALWWQYHRTRLESGRRLWLVATGFSLLALSGVLDALDDFDARLDDFLGTDGSLHEVVEKLVGLTLGRVLVVVGVLVWIADMRQRFRRTNEALAAERDVAEQASRAKSRFLAAMSHDLRTPLNAIIGFADVLATGERSAARKRQLDTIAEAGHSLLTMINDLLDLSKIEAGQVQPVSQIFLIEDELAYLHSLFAPRAEAKGLAFEIGVGAEVPKALTGDNALLRQVLVNLIDNALKFTERGSVLVDVSARGEGAEAPVLLVFRVTDTGCGIAAEDVDQIFDWFTQLGGRARKRGDGSGLGLAIARRIATILGGTLSVASEPGVGSRFTLTARFERVALSETGQARRDPDRSVEAVPSGCARPILVVDHDRFSRELMNSILQRAGYAPTAAPDADQALALLQTGDYHLVVMDIQLPGQGGAELAARIRSGGVPNCDPHVPILVITAYATEGEEPPSAETVTDGAIAKPINARRVVEVIDRLVSSGRHASE